MINQEAERKPIEVTFTKPFQIFPRFGNIKVPYSNNEAILDTIPLAIQGGGVGIIEIVYNPGDLNGDNTLPIRVPTGEVRTTSIYNDGGAKVDQKEFPIELDISVGRLPREILESLRFELAYGEKRFRADLYIDGMFDPDTNQPITAARGYSYTDLRDQARCYVILPQDPEVFRNLHMTLSSDFKAHLENV